MRGYTSRGKDLRLHYVYSDINYMKFKLASCYLYIGLSFKLKAILSTNPILFAPLPLIIFFAQLETPHTVTVCPI